MEVTIQSRAQAKTSKDTMTSLQIAELTGKMHKHVLDAIRTMEPAWEEITGTKFRLSEYKDSTGRTLPCYELSKTECLYIATKFNDQARAKLVIRWEELETDALKPVTIDFIEAFMTKLYRVFVKLENRITFVMFFGQNKHTSRCNGYSYIALVATSYGCPTSVSRCTQCIDVLTKNEVRAATFLCAHI